MSQTPRGLAIGALSGLALAAGATPALAQAAQGNVDRTFEVTITNTTTGQPFSPPYVATSKWTKFPLFKVGKYASSAIQEVAENGDTALTMRNYLAQAKRRGTIYDWAGGVPPGTKPLAPAGTPGERGEAVNSSGAAAGPCSALNFPCPSTQTITVHATNSASKLSLASMLVCTNDGFVGLAGVKMPEQVGGTLTFQGRPYSTGTEHDTQTFEDIMPWCQSIVGVFDQDPHPAAGNPFGPLSGTVMTHPLLAEGGRVTRHAGIAQAGELSAVHGWSGPVATISVKRVA